jgi:tetratricopeptide (TPR) repeat protein
MSQLINVADGIGDRRGSVVFVHGLGGHPFDTWRRGSDDGSFWLLWLAKDIPGLAVWTLSYEAPPTNWMGTAMPIQDRARNVLELLLGERGLRDLPLIFVCHSLGGLLVKQVLRVVHDRSSYDAEALRLLASVKGVVFIATPHTGSSLATLLDKLRLLARPSASTLDLERNSAHLRDLNLWYRNWSGGLRHKVFYEKQGTAAGIIVADDSSDPGLLHVDPVGIDADHQSISKPRDAEDLLYVRTRDFVAETIALPAGTVEPIEDLLRNRHPPLTAKQIDQFIESLRKLRGDPTFEHAVEEAKKGKTHIAEGIWRQIYEDREKAVLGAQQEQAEAARNLAASAVTNSVAEGLAWYRKAVALDPDSMEGQIGLGDAAINAGSLEEAGTAFRRYLELAQAARDDREVGVGLVRLGNVQKVQGDLAGALKSYRDSFTIDERLATSDPGNSVWQSDLSVSLIMIGDVQVARGDLAGALKSYRDGLAIAERLATSDPGNAGWQRGLSASFERVGNVQVAQGDVAGALKAYRDSLAIFERLVKSDPGNAERQRDLSVSFFKVGEVQVAQGDRAGALESYRRSHAIRERLAKSDPGNAGWQRDLSVSLDKVGDMQRAQGNLAGALKSYRDGLVIAERLAKSDPGNADWQRDLSVSLDKVGDVQVAQRDLAGALKSYRDSLVIRECLTKSDPGNAQWQRDLAVAFNKVGDVQVEQGDLTGAHKFYGDSLAIFERLAKSNLGNAGWQRDLSLSFYKVGDVQVAQRDLAGALKFYLDSLAIAERLATSDPGNAVWQRDLAAAFAKVGDVQVKQADLTGAHKSYGDSLAIFERLAKSDPVNADWQHDLAALHSKIAIILQKSGDPAKALDSLRQGRDIMARATALSPDKVRWKSDLAGFDQEIAKLAK